jgi:hypothetical protein
LSSSDVWAVGVARVSITETNPLLAHWDGASWTLRTAADLHLTLGSLEAVDATAPDNVWAVGQYGLVLHWDGQAWKQVALPESMVYASLYGVDALSSDDVWVTGTLYILHWDGVQWTDTTPSSDPDFDPGVRYADIAMLSDHDGWVIGDWSLPTDSSPSGRVILRWDGSKWNETSDPKANPKDSQFLYAGDFCCSPGANLTVGRISVTDANNIWAVGGFFVPLVAHWDGTAWTRDACPSGEYTMTSPDGRFPKPVPGFGGPLFDVATISNGVAWAVGAIYDDTNSGSGYVLDLRHGPCPTPVPTATWPPPPTYDTRPRPTYTPPPQTQIAPVATVIMPFSQATVPVPLPSGVIPNPIVTTLPQP